MQIYSLKFDQTTNSLHSTHAKQDIKSYLLPIRPDPTSQALYSQKTLGKFTNHTVKAHANTSGVRKFFGGNRQAFPEFIQSVQKARY